MPLINLERIKAHRLETDPYRWTAITDLYTPDDADKLGRDLPLRSFQAGVLVRQRTGILI